VDAVGLHGHVWVGKNSDSAPSSCAKHGMLVGRPCAPDKQPMHGIQQSAEQPKSCPSVHDVQVRPCLTVAAMQTLRIIIYRRYI
jgi:hypothetical protein